MEGAENNNAGSGKLLETAVDQIKSVQRSIYQLRKLYGELVDSASSLDKQARFKEDLEILDEIAGKLQDLRADHS